MNDLEFNQQLERLQADVKKKIENGRDGIYTAEHLPEKRHVGLAHALNAYHGALEDHFRAALATKLQDSDRENILNLKETSWKDLLQFGKKLLNLSQNEADQIWEANYYRNEQSAHGDKFAWEEVKLRQYIKLVEKWCSKEFDLLHDQLPYHEPKTQSPVPKPPQKPKTTVPSYVPKPPTQGFVDPTPWYREIWFLWLMFLFVNPIWALIIIKEKDGNGCLKVVAWFSLISSVIYFFAFFYLRDKYLSPEGSFNLDEFPIISSTETKEPNNYLATSDNAPEPTNTAHISIGTCELTWEEYRESDLSNMNRSMVWEKIVYQRVRESGMTAREFYNLVLIHNSSLAADGYVFKKDKIYFLPRCE